ncbi:MAG: MFS transporter [Burkholderiaceae bacterium]
MSSTLTNAVPAEPPVRLAFAMWAMAAAFYLFDFFQRVSPAALALDLSREIAPTAVALGSLSSAYFVTYALLQLPGGMLIDRFGTRKVFVVACLLGGVGTWVFASAHGPGVGALGRLILGASGAVAWVGMLKLASQWFTPARFASITGVSLAIGAVGAVASGLPLRMASDAAGWRSVIMATGLFALALGLLIAWRMRDTPALMGYANHQHPSRPSTDDGAHKMPWRDLAWLCVGQMGVTGSMAALAWLWAVPYLTTQFGQSPAQATFLSSMMMVFFATGAIVFGTLSDRRRTRQTPLLWGTGLTGLLMAVLASGLVMDSLLLTVVVLWLLGGTAGSMVLSFVLAKDLVHGHRTATIVALVNLCVMLGSIGLPPLFGAILDHFWTGLLVDGVRQYPAHAFQWALGTLAGWIGITWLAQRMVREDPTFARRPAPESPAP